MVYKDYFGAGYSHDEIMAFNGNKDMKLTVIGNPYLADNKELSDIIGQAMSGNNPGLPIRFSDTPTDAPNSPLRTVVLFNPAQDALGQTLCGNALPSPSENDSPDIAMLTLCKNTSEFSTVWLKIPNGAKPGDEEFAFAFATATRTLFKLRPDPRSGAGATCLFGSC
ncbi:hypothetical protein HH303_16325 [Rhodospirillaceae bacterium KN72]|uniref:Uncharacterized protein n=1 Tax=Pacificispira spongiicola TaxID=2729598 RepID=A0A7Y0E2M3_9PROT|nr:hypothetical protein [Pacificispira spongiicola]NMM46061.1 hypothetical protein [Pacificispira spongiicola]